jgi:hypothetical protein
MNKVRVNPCVSETASATSGGHDGFVALTFCTAIPLLLLPSVTSPGPENLPLQHDDDLIVISPAVCLTSPIYPPETGLQLWCRKVVYNTTFPGHRAEAMAMDSGEQSSGQHPAVAILNGLLNIKRQGEGSRGARG